MLEQILWVVGVGFAVPVVSTPAVALLRRRGWIRPLLDAERRWRLPVRMLGLFLWSTLSAAGALALANVMESSMDWGAQVLGWVAWAGLTALGVGVALL
ncbi:MAG TPA: hypothetical protein VGA70_12255 [Longimicrobiales bacterium]|jgi:hypothetical protein